MNREQLDALLDTLLVAGKRGLESWAAYMELLREAKASLVRTAYQPPVTQAEVDYLINVYSPRYVDAVQRIEDAGDAINSDDL